MGQPQAQLNPYVDDDVVTLSVLNPVANGSTDTSILVFDNGVVGPRTTHMDAVTTAEAGTIVRVWRDGIYLVSLDLSQEASSTTIVGISLNGTALNVDPVAGTAGVLAAWSQTLPAATVVGIGHAFPVPIRGADINVPGGRALIRVHCTNGAGAAGGGAITAATARVTVRRLIGLQ